MAEEIQRLVHEVYQITLKEQEAEIMLLQHQMNPHFMYNTLETINMMAVMRDEPEISELVVNLSRLMRYTISGEERETTLSEELKFAESYAGIQSRRLGERFRLEINVPRKYRDLSVPKLILQPFIENCIEHGFKHPKTVMQILARRRGEILQVDLCNDGLGMSPEEKSRLKKSLRTAAVEPEWNSQPGKIRKGIALRNIHHRIQLMYGNNYGVTVLKTNGGASFRLLLPVRNKSKDA
jgi:two-component system sensor histidine kinase YesM